MPTGPCTQKPAPLVPAGEMGWRMKSDKPTAKRRPAHRGSSSRRNASDIRERILTAAFREFADKGLDGARVDKIATRAGVNKGMLYHYFGSKERLFSAALERLYVTIRAKQGSLQVRDLKPEQAMRKLIGHPAEIWMEHPDFFGVLNSENLHQARHVKRSKQIIQMYKPVLEQMKQLPGRGKPRRNVSEGDRSARPLHLHFGACVPLHLEPTRLRRAVPHQAPGAKALGAAAST